MKLVKELAKLNGISLLVLLRPWRPPIIVKLRPLEIPTSFLPRCIPHMTHPHVPPLALLLPLYALQHRRYPTLASWRVCWMKIIPVMPVRDVDALVPGNGVRIDGRRRGDGVFIGFLHFGVHG